MQKIVICGALIALTSLPAAADVVVRTYPGYQPVPGPAYVVRPIYENEYRRDPNYWDRHHDYDWHYWHHDRDDRERAERDRDREREHEAREAREHWNGERW